ncbi:MAG: hypothetical protein HY597_05950 [Candidatus Omnitrophica bacterium]|nr:hypothetical protein [Candidatus Omnitrophota bacterium]
MQRGWIVGVMLALVALPSVALAAGKQMSGGAKCTISFTKEYTASPWTSEAEYGKRAFGKLGFGAKNLLLGWTELFTEPKEAIEGGGNFFGGLWRGLVKGVGDEVGGAVHIVTFPFTEIDVPLPEGGVSF